MRRVIEATLEVVPIELQRPIYFLRRTGFEPTTNTINWSKYETGSSKNKTYSNLKDVAILRQSNDIHIERHLLARLHPT
ncbi:hypothetical protein HBH99_142100 [Parastagonospora nodorum]|nr:hypothetical protein HBH99_142100 [Parastagonospora nodorum]